MAKTETHLEAAGRTVRLSSPDKVLFPDQGWTKLDIAEHYLLCAEGAVRGVHRRPCSLKRWPNGVTEDFFFTKRAPGDDFGSRWPSASPRPGRARWRWSTDVSDIIDQVQLGVLDLNPWNSRAETLDHPDELRLDLDPTEGLSFDDCRPVAEACRVLLEEHGLIGWPKTSGSRGIHVYVRLEPRWTFEEVRRAGLALGPRTGAPPARPRHHRLVEGGAHRGLPGLQPERQGQDHRQRLQRPADRSRLHAVRLGRTR